MHTASYRDTNDVCFHDCGLAECDEVSSDEYQRSEGTCCFWRQIRR